MLNTMGNSGNRIYCIWISDANTKHHEARRQAIFMLKMGTGCTWQKEGADSVQKTRRR